MPRNEEYGFDIVVTEQATEHPYFIQWGVEHVILRVSVTVETYGDVWRKEVQPMIDANPQRQTYLQIEDKGLPDRGDKEPPQLEKKGGKKE